MAARFAASRAATEEPSVIDTSTTSVSLGTRSGGVLIGQPSCFALRISPWERPGGSLRILRASHCGNSPWERPGGSLGGPDVKAFQFVASPGLRLPTPPRILALFAVARPHPDQT